MTKNLFLPTVLSFLLITPLSVYASGSYTPSGGSTNSGADYNKAEVSQFLSGINISKY